MPIIGNDIDSHTIIVLNHNVNIHEIDVDLDNTVISDDSFLEDVMELDDSWRCS